jgi:endogenous inhibitor of DNA gyrase (YacG/DUF329 family)
MVQRCRYCDRKLDPADPARKEFGPFCSDRCRMAELGLWLEGRYAISRPLDQVADDAAQKPPARLRGAASAADSS